METVIPDDNDYDRHWKHDWIGEWYPIFRSLDEQTEMIFAKCTLPGEIIDLYYLDHSLYDGVGALQILSAQNNTPAICYRNQQNPRPNFFRQIFGLLSYLADTKVRSIPWRNRDHDISGKKRTPQIYVMSKEQTQDLLGRARSSGVSLSIFILKCLNEIVSNLLQYPEVCNIWLLPVNMRSNIKRRNPLSNHYSYVAVKVHPLMKMAEMDTQFKKALDNGYHWASWWGLLIGKFIGLKGMRNIIIKYHNKKHCWTGVLSNMGVWGNPDSQHTWAACAPITRVHPIGVAFMTWNGQLSVSLQIHPSLDRDGSVAPAVMKLLRENL